MQNPFSAHPVRSAGIVVAVLAGLAWLAFAYFGVHTLFIDDVVSEAAPVFDTPAPAPAPATSPTTPADDSRVDPSADTTEQPTAVDASSPTTAPATPPTAPPSDPPEPTIVTELAGTFVDEAHPTSGRAVVLGNGTGQRFLRFEDFTTDNGPDLNVYLVNSSTGDVSDFVDLGDLTGNVGEQNYEIPLDVDLDVYDRVVIWCVRFGVGFGSASLTAV